MRSSLEVHGDICFADVTSPGLITTDQVVKAQLIAHANRAGMTVREYVELLLCASWWLQRDFRDAVNEHLRLLCSCTVASDFCPLHGRKAD